MKTLLENIRRNGFDYNLVERNNKSAIYEQKIGNFLVSYEVFKIKHKKGSVKLNIEDYEGFPVDEDFGKTAWSVKSLEKAKEIYSGL